MPAEQRKDIRIRMRARRQRTDATSRTSAAANICARLTSCDSFKTARHIAAYFPNDGEINTWHVIRHAWSTDKFVYLPVLQPANALGFVLISEETQWQDNRYGIPEPCYSTAELVPATKLDLVLMPVVAFDDAMYRLGMGGGYYDRSFAFVGNRENTRPELIGLAYEFQHVSTVYPEPWDVPATCIVTDKSVHKKVSEL